MSAASHAMRLDAPIAIKSRLRNLFFGGLLGLFLWLTWSAGLAIWQLALVGLVLILVSGFTVLSKPALLHLSQPPLHRNACYDWQLLMATAHGEQLWQADLLRVRSYFWVVIADFRVVEPYQKSLTITIYRDQVLAEDWRKLSIVGQVLG